MPVLFLFLSPNDEPLLKIGAGRPRDGDRRLGKLHRHGQPGSRELEVGERQAAVCGGRLGPDLDGVGLVAGQPAWRREHGGGLQGRIGAERHRGEHGAGLERFGAEQLAAPSAGDDFRPGGEGRVLL
jgi:hypothetical protein